ncbi:MAG: amino acid ABC transporter substrate-binding protein [Phreatobacter sp.]
MRKALFATLAAALVAQAAPASAGTTLDTIRQRGSLKCAVQGPSNPGFGVPDSQGRWTGFNVDLCRAVAIMIFGDPDKIQISALTTQTRFPALQSGEVDLLTNNTTVTLTRDTQLKFNFPAITFFDGQGILVPRRLNLTSGKQLSGATVCVQPGTTTELALTDFFRKNNMRFTPVVIQSRDELTRAYADGRCDALTSDATTLAAQRSTLANPADHVILPDRLSKEPLGLAVRHGDEEFRDIVAWAFNTLVNAEELGITRANVDEMAKSTDPEIRRFLGVEPGLGVALGVDDRFGYAIIKALGNYGELYEKYLGEKTPLAIPRGLNRLYTDGGSLYTPPSR